MGVEKLAFTLRTEPETVERIDKLRSTRYPLASRSAVASLALAMGVDVIDKGVITQPLKDTQQIHCVESTERTHRVHDQRTMLAAWIMDIFLDYTPCMELVPPQKVKPGPRKAETQKAKAVSA